jgi:hypothetical protein
MSNIILDHKMFDYASIKGPLLAVPESMFRGIMSNKFAKTILSPYMKYFKIKSTNSGLRKLTEEDILEGIALAKKERREGKLIYL